MAIINWNTFKEDRKTFNTKEIFGVDYDLKYTTNFKVSDYCDFMEGDLEKDYDRFILCTFPEAAPVLLETLEDVAKKFLVIKFLEFLVSKNKEEKTSAQKQKERLGIKEKKTDIEFSYFIGKFLSFYTGYKLEDVLELKINDFWKLFEVIPVIKAEDSLNLLDITDNNLYLKSKKTADKYTNLSKKYIKQMKSLTIQEEKEETICNGWEELKLLAKESE